MNTQSTLRNVSLGITATVIIMIPLAATIWIFALTLSGSALGQIGNLTFVTPPDRVTYIDPSIRVTETHDGEHVTIRRYKNGSVMHIGTDFSLDEWDELRRIYTAIDRAVHSTPVNTFIYPEEIPRTAYEGHYATMCDDSHLFPISLSKYVCVCKVDNVVLIDFRKLTPAKIRVSATQPTERDVLTNTTRRLQPAEIDTPYLRNSDIGICLTPIQWFYLKRLM